MHDVLVVALLVLSSWRATRLITKDTFPPLLAARDRLAGGWRPLTQQEWEAIRSTAAKSNRDLARTDRPKSVPVSAARMYAPLQAIDGVENRYLTRAPWSPFWLAELVSCGWCASGWVSGALTAATALATSLPDPWLVGPAVWAGAALLSTREWA